LGVERISLSGSAALKGYSGVVAGPGDILLARVGKRLHQKVVFVSRGYALLTDCVYKIQAPKNLRLKVYKALTSEYGERLLISGAKGVGAQILAKKDLISFPLIPSVGARS
jgi:type I restriction enzyme M protein